MSKIKWSDMTKEQKIEEMKKRYPQVDQYLQMVDLAPESDHSFVSLAPKPVSGYAPVVRGHDGTNDSGDQSPHQTDLFKKIRSLVLKQVEHCSIGLYPNTRFKEDLGFDALMAVELVLALEEEFDLEVPDEDLDDLFTIQDVVRYIESRQGDKKENESMSNLQDTVLETIESLCEDLEPFTSLDVSNAVKQAGNKVRHREVARFLRSAFDDGELEQHGYTRQLIDVTLANGQKAQTWLYRHQTVSADSYNSRDQVALRPDGSRSVQPKDDVAAVAAAAASTPSATSAPAPRAPAPAAAPQTAAPAPAPTRTATPVTTTRARTKSQVQKGDGRLEIPGDWISFLQWEEGTEVHAVARTGSLLLTERLPTGYASIRKFTVDRWGRIRLTTGAMSRAGIDRGAGASHTLELQDNGILVR